QAVARYQGGHFKQAGFYLAAAEKLDGAGMNRRAAAHKLRGLLALADGRPGRAADSFVRSVAVRPDPFLFYWLGHYNLRMRSLSQALNSYRSAVQTLDKNFRRGGSRRDRMLHALLPYQCPTAQDGLKDGGSAWLTRRRRDPFSNPHLGVTIWNRNLHPLEYAAAAHMAWVLARHMHP